MANIINQTTLRGGVNPCISAIRLIAMSLIIACHILQYYDNKLAWQLNIGVQIFFILSGFLYGNKDIDDSIRWIRKNLYKIILPYWIFLVIVIVSYLLFAPEYINLNSCISALLGISTIKGVEHLWFVGYIIVCYLITPYLHIIARSLNTNNTLSKNVLILICTITIYYIIQVMTNAYFNPDKISCYILGYYSAIFIKMYKLEYKKVALGMILLSLIMICIRFICAYCDCIEPILYSQLVKISYIIIAFAITFSLMIILKKIRYNKLLLFSDKYSYTIYLVHQLFILSPFTLLRATDYMTINVIIVVAVTIASSCLLKFLSNTTDAFISRYFTRQTNS